MKPEIESDVPYSDIRGTDKTFQIKHPRTIQRDFVQWVFVRIFLYY